MKTIRQISIASVPSLAGKKVLVTGANSGIGLEAARSFAALGATVLLGCRDVSKGEEAAKSIRATTPKADLQVIALDLASLASIKAAAAKITSLDILVNNAGVMAIPKTKTADGFEMQFGVNHLGTFALTALLAPILVDREGARVISTTSMLAHRGKMNFDDLMGDQTYDKGAAYSQSKLSNQLFAYELERRLRAAGKKAISVACHPGYSATNLQSRGPQMSGSAVMGVVMKIANSLIAQPAEKGAQATVIAAGSPDVHGGELVGFDGPNEMRGHTAIVAPPERATDLEAARQLWAKSEALTVPFTI